jgi:hypothetical protein
VAGTAAVIVALMLVFPPGALSQRSKPKILGVFDGDTMYSVLPPDAIPAVRNPVFLSSLEADAQMSPDEPVLGVVVNGEAKAYSLWQLDAHEIVDDVIGGTPIAATW